MKLPGCKFSAYDVNPIFTSRAKSAFRRYMLELDVFKELLRDNGLATASASSKAEQKLSHQMRY